MTKTLTFLFYVHIHVNMAQTPNQQWHDNLGEPQNCLCTALGRAYRAVQSDYETALGASGISPTQFTILTALVELQQAPISDLAAAIGTDRTTLTRTIAPLIARGLVVDRRGDDRRVRLIAISNRGRDIHGQALGAWERAQSRLISRLGFNSAKALLTQLGSISSSR